MQEDKMIKTVATKIMGWHLNDHPELHGNGQWFSEYEYQQWFNSDNIMVANHNWNPLDNDEDCMMAWDKFVVMNGVEIFKMDLHKLFMLIDDYRRKAIVEYMIKFGNVSTEGN